MADPGDGPGPGGPGADAGDGPPAGSADRFDVARDPRPRLAFTVGVVLVALASPSLPPLLALAGMLAAVVAAGRDLALPVWIRSLSPFALLVPLILMLNLFFYAEGPVVWGLAVPGVPIAVTEGGVRTSIHIALRLVVVAAAAAWFALVTDAEEFEVSLARLGVPWKLAFLGSLTLRLVPEMERRFRAIEDAQRARGLRIGGGPINRARARIPMLIPFLVSTIGYGYDIGEALDARHFGAAPRRTYLLELERRRGDGLFYVGAVAILVGFLVLVGV